VSVAAWRTRSGNPEDINFLQAMLYEAAFWNPTMPRPDIDEALADPHLALYIEGWGRTGDLAVIALDADAQPAGAAWLRRFSPDAPGYGFIDAETPELSIGIRAEYRSQGAGTALMAALLDAARAHRITAVSLSVDPVNPALRLYERFGFVRVGESGGSWTMRRALSSRLPAVGEQAE
jgi:ribosomal protein S18 acetylase RimI-like enzyme